MDRLATNIPDHVFLLLFVFFLSPTSYATWESGAGRGEVGELVLTVWNTLDDKSFTQDLGIQVSNPVIMETNGFQLELNHDGLEHVGGTAAAGVLMWNIAGNAFDPEGVSENSDFSYYSSYLTQTSDPRPATHSHALLGSNSTHRFEDYKNHLESYGAVVGTVDDPVYLLEGRRSAALEYYWGSSVRGWTNYGMVNETATQNGRSLYAYSFRLDAYGSGVTLQSGSQWTLDATNGVLSYGTMSSVPLPAGIWLFLFGLGCIWFGKNRVN